MKFFNIIFFLFSLFLCKNSTAETLTGDAIVCYGTVGAAFSATGVYDCNNNTYNLQMYINSAWTDVGVSQCSNTYNCQMSYSGTFTQTSYFRLRTHNNGPFCSADYYSNSVTITVLPQVGGGTASGDQSICYNTIPNQIQVTAPSDPATPGYTYQWQSTTNNIIWNNISGATSQNYTPIALTTTTWFRRVTTFSACGTYYSAAVQITVLPNLVSGLISSNQTVCYNTAPSQLNGEAATGGTGSYTYQWYLWPASQSGFSAIPGAVNQNYVPAAALESQIYQRSATSGKCGTVNSNTIVITVLPDLIPGAISKNQTICTGNTPAQLTGTSASGGNSTYTYQWQWSTDASTWNNVIDNAKSINLQPIPLSSNTYYRRLDNSYGCTAKATNMILITVNQGFTAGVIGSDQTICYSNTPATLIEMAATSGTNDTYTFQWYSSSDNVTYSPISGATSKSYLPTALTTTTYFKRLDISTVCGNKFTNMVKVFVNSQITPGAVTPQYQQICYNTAPQQYIVSLPSGGDGNYSYQWQISTNGGTIYTNIPGATSLNYQSSNLTNQVVGFRLAINSSTCPTAYSSVEGVVVFSDLNPGTIGNSQTICYNAAPIKLTSSGASGSDNFFHQQPVYSYQWQTSTDFIIWTDVLGATAPSYQPPALTQTTYFKMKVSNDGCTPKYTNIISITVSANFIAGGIGSDHTICYNNVPHTLTETTGSAATSYEWYNSTDNVSYSLIIGANSKNLLPGALTQTTYFKRNDISSCGNGFTNIVKVSVNPIIIPGILSPTSQLICYNTKGNTITATNATGGDGNYTYQWYSSIDNISWTDIPAANALNYSPIEQTAKVYYRRKESSSTCDTKYTASVSIDVLSDIVAGTISADQKICFNTTPVLLNSTGVSGGGAVGQSVVYNYQWQASTDLITWANLLISATSNTYQPGALTQTTYYRLNVSSNGCASKNTNIVTITVYPDLTIGAVASPQTICYTTKPVLLSGGVPAGGNGTFTYQWYSSFDQLSATLITGAVLQDFQPPALSSNIYYSRVVTTYNCTSKQSAWVKITVQNNIVSGSVTAAQDITYNAVPNPLNSTPAGGGNGAYTYQWQSSLDDTLFANITGANNTTYSPAALKNSTYFRIQTFSSGCGPVSSKSIAINVFGQLKPGVISNSQVICYADAPAILTGTTPVGGSGSFFYQWQTSLDKQKWADIVDGTAISYTPPSLTQSTYYKRRVIASLSNDTAYSNTIAVVVRQLLSPGTISMINGALVDTTCTGNIGGINITGTTPTGASGIYNYSWEWSYNNSSWNLTSSTGPSYMPGGNINQDVYYHRKVYDATCKTTIFSNSVKFALISPISDGQVPGNQTVCYNTIPNQLSFTPVSGGEGKYLYQWQESQDSSKWFNINGGTSVSYQPPLASVKKWYRRNVSSSYCLGNLSDPIKVDVMNYFNPGSITGNQTICYNTNPAQLNGTLPTGATNNYSYQWQNSNDGITWTSITGVALQNYRPGRLTSNTYFRRRAIGGTCVSDFTSSILVSVLNDINPGTIKATSSPICYNSNQTALVTLTDASGGDQNFTYQWQSATDGFNWIDINGATTSNYRPMGLKTLTYFRKEIKTICGNFFTNAEKVIVNSPLFAGAITGNQVIAYGKIPDVLSGSLANGADGNNTYQWQFSNDSLNWVNIIVNGNSKDYQPGSLFITTYYKRVVTSGCGMDVTNSVKVIVSAKLIPGTISASQTICYNTSPAQLTGTQPSGSNGAYFYKWQSSDDGLTWSNIASNSINTTYSPVALTASKYYRRMVYTSIKDSALSNIVVVNVYGVLSGGNLSGKNTICYNQEAPIITATPGTGGSGTYAYQWQISNNLVIWTDYTSISSDYIPSARLIQSGYFRRKITDVCGTKYSDTTSIIVRSKFKAGIIGNSQTIAYGKVPVLLSGTSSTGGDGAYNYIWQFSENGNNWSNVIVSGNNKDYQPNNLFKTISFRRIDIAGCGQDTTNTITVTVLPMVLPGTISASQTICYNTLPAKLTGTGATGGDGNYTYQWQFSNNGTKWLNVIINSGTSDYQPGAITGTTYFRLAVKCQNYDTAYSNIIILDNYKPLVSGKIASDSKILCYGSTPAALITNTYPSGGTGNYTYQWQFSNNRAIWTNVTGATNDYYLETAKLTQTTYYRKMVTDKCGIAYSDTVKILINPKFSAGIVGSDQVIGTGEIPAVLTGTEPIGGLGHFQYQWIRSLDKHKWTVSINDTLIGLNPANITGSVYLARIDQTTCGTDTTNAVNITILPNFKAGVLSPISQTACYNAVPQTITGTSATGGNGSYTYQWQSSKDGTLWTDINGANSQNYAPGQATLKSYFRRIDKTLHFTNLTTLNAVVDVYANIPAPAIDLKPFYCKNTTALLNVLSPSNSLNYQWLDYQLTFLANGASYQINKLSQDTKLYIQAVSMIGCKSDAAVVNVRIDSIKASFTAAQTFIENGNAIKFNNTSIHATSYAWNFFEGEVMTTAEPFHYFNSTGKKDVLLTVTSSQGCVDSLLKKDVLEVIPRTPTGIPGSDNLYLKIKAYPIPVENELTVDFGNTTGNCEVKVVNLIGQNIFSMENIKTGQILIPAEEWAPGVYYLLVKEDKTVQTLKIVK